MPFLSKTLNFESKSFIIFAHLKLNFHCFREEKQKCLNNLKLNRNLIYEQQQLHHLLDNNQQKKRHHQKNEKLLRGSLENVSCNPFGDVTDPLDSSLKRSRSLALIRDDIFTNFDVTTSRRSSRRSQLIPRAKLIDRNHSKERFFFLIQNLKKHTYNIKLS